MKRLTAGLSASWHKLSLWEDFPLFFYMPEDSGSISFGGLFSLQWLVYVFSEHASSVFSLALAFKCVCFVSIDLHTTTLHYHTSQSVFHTCCWETSGGGGGVGGLSFHFLLSPLSWHTRSDRICLEPSSRMVPVSRVIRDLRNVNHASP